MRAYSQGKSKSLGEARDLANSDQIARFILNMLQQDGGIAELQRSALAERFGCVPSQINYVIATRFSPEQGYAVESRRGGGGYIRISRVHITPRQLVMHTVNALGMEICEGGAEAMLRRAVPGGAVPAGPATVMAAAVSDRALRPAMAGERDAVRASVLKHMLVSWISTDFPKGDT